MEDTDENNSDRVNKMLSDVGERVENLREQAASIQREKENILGLLQDMQALEIKKNMPEVEREDIDSTTERLILRCLTVEVSVSTPRNETQEETYQSVTYILDDLHQKFQQDPKKHSDVIESYLNACLPEPFSSNLDTRFQSKILGCTLDDQKCFRHQLQSMYRIALKMPFCNGSKEKNGESSSQTNNNAGAVKEIKGKNSEETDECKEFVTADHT